MLRVVRRHLRKASLMSNLSVSQHARADAQQSPATPGEALSPTEMRLDEYLGHRMANLRHRRERALQSERVNVIATDLAAEERSFADFIRGTKSAIWQAHLRFDDASREARNTVAERIEDRTKFKREHRLNREALQPDLVLTTGVLAVTFVGETLLNAVLFAEVSRWGLLGGAQWSALLSLPNLALGVLAGFCGARARNHMHPPVRRIGRAALFSSAGAVVLWNLSVAHFRAFAERRGSLGQELRLSDWRDATAQVFLDPGALFASPHAIVLFGVGCAVFAVSLYHGLHGFSDPYPGYGRVDARVQRALAHVLRLKWAFFAEITALTDQAVRSIKKRLLAITGKADAALHILDRARGINLRFARAAGEEFWVYAACLRSYQARNRTCRGGVGIPARFDAPVTATASLPDYDWRTMRDRIHAIALAAETAAEEAILALHDHRLELMHAVDRQALDAGTPSARPAPPVVQLTPEAADAHA
jgi:hypothetical protein